MQPRVTISSNQGGERPLVEVAPSQISQLHTARTPPVQAGNKIELDAPQAFLTPRGVLLFDCVNVYGGV